jgi:hypothetical protein
MYWMQGYRIKAMCQVVEWAFHGHVRAPFAKWGAEFEMKELSRYHHCSKRAPRNSPAASALTGR